jgi:hypothetical protein
LAVESRVNEAPYANDKRAGEPNQNPFAIALVLREESGGNEREPVSDAHGDHDVGSGEKNLVEVASLAIGRRVEQRQKEKA